MSHPPSIVRESMEYDVVIVSGGPGGLSAAIRLKQLALAAEVEISVCVIEKGAEIGSHILSGAVLDPTTLDELIPDWKERGAPLDQPVTGDEFWYLRPKGAIRFPNLFIPPVMNNHGNYIVSLGKVCRWLSREAEALGVEIFPGFAAAEILFDSAGAARGVTTGDMGVSKSDEPKSNFTPGVELHAKYTLFVEGAGGSLSKLFIKRFRLDRASEPRKFRIDIKELWEVDPSRHHPGLNQRYQSSSIFKDLFAARNMKPLLGRFGTLLGTILNGAYLKAMKVQATPECKGI